MKRSLVTDFIIAVAIGLIITVVFADGRLDMATADAFYDPGADDHWSAGRRLPWSVLYQLAPWITGAIVVASLGFLGLAVIRRSPVIRRNAVFVLATLVLGPGLLVNAIFKDHWHRPRPRDVVEFGGQLHYKMAPLRGEWGKSFPCGHCSVGFLTAAGWWIWRRGRPRFAWASLGFGLVLGSALGVGRIAAGGHFASDIVWSAFISLGIAHFLYWHVLQIPVMRSPGREAPFFNGRWLATAAALGGLCVLGALFIAAHGRAFDSRIVLASLPRSPQAFEFTAQTADVEIVLTDAPGDVQATGELHGFGVPGSRLTIEPRFEQAVVPTLRYVIEQEGWFTDLDARVSIRLPVADIRRITIHVAHGTITLKDRTQNRVVSAGQVQLDLHSATGKVQLDIARSAPSGRR